MNLSNGQKWFLVITFGFSIMFFIISTALTMFPPSNTFSTPEKERAGQYTKCIQQAGNYFYGDSETLAISQCAQLFQLYNTKQ